jgi:hypothetical protein
LKPIDVNQIAQALNKEMKFDSATDDLYRERFRKSISGNPSDSQYFIEKLIEAKQDETINFTIALIQSVVDEMAKSDCDN